MKDVEGLLDHCTILLDVQVKIVAEVTYSPDRTQICTAVFKHKYFANCQPASPWSRNATVSCINAVMSTPVMGYRFTITYCTIFENVFLLMLSGPISNALHMLHRYYMATWIWSIQLYIIRCILGKGAEKKKQGKIVLFLTTPPSDPPSPPGLALFPKKNWPIILWGKLTIDAWNKFYIGPIQKSLYLLLFSVSFAQNRPKSDIWDQYITLY